MQATIIAVADELASAADLAGGKVEGRPVVVVRGGHEYILNAAALARSNITADTPAPAGGRITRYADGRLNGELVDAAKSLVRLPPPELFAHGPVDAEQQVALL